MPRSRGSALNLPGQGVVLPHPVLHLDHGVILPGAADHHPVDAGVDDEAAAHGAGGGAGDQLPRGRVLAGHVEGGPQHLPPGGGDDGVGLRCV